MMYYFVNYGGQLLLNIFDMVEILIVIICLYIKSNRSDIEEEYLKKLIFCVA